MRPRAAGASCQDASTELPERARPSRAVARNLMPNHGVRPGEPNGRDNACSADRAALRRNSYSGRDQRRPEHLKWLGKKGREHASAGKTIRSPRERRLDTGGHKNGPDTLCTGSLNSHSPSQLPIGGSGLLQLGTKSWAQINGARPQILQPRITNSPSRGDTASPQTLGEKGVARPRGRPTGSSRGRHQSVLAHPSVHAAAPALCTRRVARESLTRLRGNVRTPRGRQTSLTQSGKKGSSASSQSGARPRRSP